MVLIFGVMPVAWEWEEIERVRVLSGSQVSLPLSPRHLAICCRFKGFFGSALTCNDCTTCRDGPVSCDVWTSMKTSCEKGTNANLPRSFCSNNGICESRWSTSDQSHIPTLSLETNLGRNPNGYLRGCRKSWGNYRIPKMLLGPKELDKQ